jgi:predicted Zn-dependent protease
MLQRVAVVILALLAVGWLGVRYADSRVTKDVQATSGLRNPTPAQLESALEKARSGQTLDPSRGTEALSYQAVLLIRLKKFPEAVKVLDEIVRREPLFSDAWFLIWKFSPDPARAAEAEAEYRRLHPPVRKKKS